MSATCNIADPFILDEISRLQHPIAQHAYLLSMAAYQRGLEVSFHYSLASQPSFADLPLQGLRGELFSISDGKKTRYFRRTQADTVTTEIDDLCENKQATKRRLHSAGIAVPPGAVVQTGEEPEIDVLLTNYPGHTFLLKPLSGSLALGVIRRITADRVKTEIKKSVREPHLLEVHIHGREFRMYVVGNRLVGGHERVPAHVVGDGQRSIEALVAQKNSWRESHPAYASHPIEINSPSLEILLTQDLTPQSILKPGSVGWLSRDPCFRLGGHNQPIPLAFFSSNLQSVAVSAAQAVGIEFTGIDVIVANFGSPMERTFVLELNQCPYLSGALGDLPYGSKAIANTVAEAVIDHHFPGSIESLRHPQASFDLSSIVEVLAAGTADSVCLPVLGNNWKHLRHTIPQAQANLILIPELLAQMRALGLHVKFLEGPGGDVWIDATVRDEQIEQLRKLLTFNQNNE